MPPAPEHVSAEHICFARDAAPDAWDRVVYAPGTYDSFIWSLQREIVVALASGLAARRPSIAYLDFACGTGRVLAAERNQPHSIGRYRNESRHFGRARERLLYFHQR